MKILLCKFLLSLFCTFFVVACNKKTDPFWEVDIDAPIFYTDLDFTDVIPDSVLTTNPDQTLSMVFQFPLVDFSLESVLDFPDTISNSYLPNVSGAVINPGQTFFNFTENTVLNINNADITRVDLISGYLIMEVLSSFTEEIIITYKLPYAKKNGVPFEITETVPASNSGTMSHHSVKVDISGYSFDMRGPTHLSTNIIQNITLAKLDPAGNPITITDQDQFVFNVRFSSLKIAYAKGSFGTTTYTFGPDTSSIDAFGVFKDGVFNLDNAKVMLEVKNGFGIDLQGVFENISTLNTVTGVQNALNDPVIGQILNISRSIETGNTQNPVTPSWYNYSIDHTTAAQIINTRPDKISYKMRVTTNPLGNISAGNDFVYHNNYLDANLLIDIPLNFSSERLTFADTVFMEMGEYNENPGSGTVRLIADNGFPFSAQIQIYLLDNNNLVVDSIMPHNNIDAPLLDDQLKVVAPRRTVHEFFVSKEKYKLLFNTKKAWVVARFTTANYPQAIKIYSYYKLKLKLTANFNYLIEL